MVAIWVTCSHAVGMGHFFRAMVLADVLRRHSRRTLILLEGYAAAVSILRSRGIAFETVPEGTSSGEWESPVIGLHGIHLWINDRLSTDAAHAQAVKTAGAVLVTLDDSGSGAELADLHIAPLLGIRGIQPAGRRVMADLRYLVLDREIERFRRRRTTAARTLVTIGGTDTHGVTGQIMRLLVGLNRSGTVVAGPGFAHHDGLVGCVAPGFTVKHAVPSLIEEMSRHDVAVTGAGVTAFEAAASGLPTFTVANEEHEIAYARFLEDAGCTAFAGRHDAIDKDAFARPIDVASMSKAALRTVPADGVEHVCRELLAL